VKGIYEMMGAADSFLLDGFDGGHQISGRHAYDFLWEALTVSDHSRGML
jgi:hypothetical protein